MNELASQMLFDAELPRLKRLAASCGWTVNEASFPVLDVSFGAETVRALRLRLRADGWNELPASVELLTPSGVPLAVGAAPRHGVFNQGPHSNGQSRPFVCMVGSREYHTHTSHLSDSWENYRQGASLLGLVTQLWHAWRKAQ